MKKDDVGLVEIVEEGLTEGDVEDIEHYMIAMIEVIGIYLNGERDEDGLRESVARLEDLANEMSLVVSEVGR
jgi:hypothetical protein